MQLKLKAMYEYNLVGGHEVQHTESTSVKHYLKTSWIMLQSNKNISKNNDVVQ
jgi:hypothetical protein